MAAAAVLAVVAALFAPATEAQAAVSLEKVADFGANPGALNMYVYRPAALPAGAPVVVALHGCTQSAQDYADHSGLTTFADTHGFLLVFAETTSANNLSRCFNWFEPSDTRRGQGEAASIRQMVAHAGSAYGADPGQAYVTGLSAGGGMTAVMLATYPDVFKAGAVIAGLPYGCATDSITAFTCMSPGVDRTPAEWAQRVTDAHPGYSGPRPRVAVWQGDSDWTVAPKNAEELRDQWTQVHGLGQSPDRTSTIGPNNTVREQYLAGDGSVAVEVNTVPGMGHGTPVDPGSGSQQCGQAGAYFLDSICSSYWIVDFFGLTGGATDPEDPGSSPTPSPSPSDPAAACWTSNNYEHVRADRASTSGGYVYAKGSNQDMGLYNVAVTHTLKESPAGHYVIADNGCP
nr:PHB depolymerase family esterase [Streptomyces sp. TP-A0874]